MTVQLLDDGYLFRSAIDKVSGLHGTLLFTRRPMLPADVEEAQAAVDAGMRSGNPRMASAAAARTIESFVTEWNVVGKGGAIVPVTAENAAKLPPAIYNKLLLVLYGSRSSDKRDDWTPDELAEWQAGYGSPVEQRKN